MGLAWTSQLRPTHAETANDWSNASAFFLGFTHRPLTPLVYFEWRDCKTLNRTLWRSAKWTAIGCLALAILSWTLLNSAVFSTLRIAAVQRLLFDATGQNVLVQDDVRVALGLASRVTVTSLVLHGQDIENLDLAEVDRVEFDIQYLDLLSGRFEPHNISLKGLRLSVVERESETQKDNTSSAEEIGAGRGNGLVFDFISAAPQVAVAFLADRSVDVMDATVFVSNDDNGFEFEFILSEFRLRSDPNSETVTVDSNGAINGVDMSFEGRYPATGSFQNIARIGDLELRYDGEKLPNSTTGGFAGVLNVNATQKGTLFEVLALNTLFGATGVVSARVESDRGYLQVTDLDALIDLEDGKRVDLNGEVLNLYSLEGLDLDVAYHFLPQGVRPAPARTLFDIELTEINATVVKDGSGVGIVDFAVSTNAFDSQFREIGPISVGKVIRSDDGSLRLNDVRVQLGPNENPYLLASGGINDALNARDFWIEGRLQAPASLFLPSLDPSRAAVFGKITSSFVASDEPGYLTVSEFSANALDTDLWDLDAEFLVDDLSKLENLMLAVEWSTEDAATFLEALALEPIDVGKFAIGFGVQTDGLGLAAGINSTANLSISGSTLLMHLSTRVLQETAIVRGRLESPSLHVEDFQKAGAASIELAKLARGQIPNSDTPIVKPFVLPKKTSSVSASESTDEAMAGSAPFALPDEIKELQLFDPEYFLQSLDLEFDIAIAELAGPGGVTSIDAPLSIKDGTADFGPLKFNYGDGNFDLSANMDLQNDPEQLFISGATSGWDLGKIVEGLGLDVPARGFLNAYLDISIAIASPQRLLNSIAGDVTVTMRDGAIGTSLIELSGLGIFPWLFSKELAQGYSRIACVKAPIRLSPGRADFSQVVLETDHVQLVSKGMIDWRRETVDVRVEPRRIGRPLSRSAWPFTVTGPLSDPTFDVESGGKRPDAEGGRQRAAQSRTPCEPDILQLSE